MVCTAGTLIGFRTQRPCVSSYRLQRYMFLGESPNVLPIFLGNFGVVLPIFLGNFAARILCIVPDSLSIMVLCDGAHSLQRPQMDPRSLPGKRLGLDGRVAGVYGGYPSGISAVIHFRLRSLRA